MRTPVAGLFNLAARGGLFRALLMAMIIMGLVMGAIFPFFVVAVLGLPLEMVFRPAFLVACLVAGVLVGLANYLLTRLVLAIPLRDLAGMAQRVADGNLKDDGAVLTGRGA
ncbi:MAG: hypothetical protein IMW93_10120 [Thermoanaerobacteraceae bacterium]|nr:hypothetical protein [Thermoanaerobacteraceae bacterium]